MGILRKAGQIIVRTASRKKPTRTEAYKTLPRGVVEIGGELRKLAPREFMGEMVRASLQEGNKSFLFNLSCIGSSHYELSYYPLQKPGLYLRFNAGEMNPKEVEGLIERYRKDLVKSNPGIKIAIEKVKVAIFRK